MTQNREREREIKRIKRKQEDRRRKNEWKSWKRLKSTVRISINIDCYLFFQRDSAANKYTLAHTHSEPPVCIWTGFAKSQWWHLIWFCARTENSILYFPLLGNGLPKPNDREDRQRKLFYDFDKSSDFIRKVLSWERTRKKFSVSLSIAELSLFHAFPLFCSHK